MKLYSNSIEMADVMHRAAPRGTHVEAYSLGRTRVRACGWNVKLLCPAGSRLTNSGTHGAGSERAASWDQYGEWIAAMYDADPSMIVGPYKGRDDFHAQTDNAYRTEVPA